MLPLPLRGRSGLGHERINTLNEKSREYSTRTHARWLVTVPHVSREFASYPAVAIAHPPAKGGPSCYVASGLHLHAGAQEPGRDETEREYPTAAVLTRLLATTLSVACGTRSNAHRCISIRAYDLFLFNGPRTAQIRRLQTTTMDR